MALPFEYDRRAARAPALQVDAPTAANVDQASKVTLGCDLRRRGSARDAECGGRTEGDGDDQGTDRMTKLQGTHDRFASFQAVISEFWKFTGDKCQLGTFRRRL